MFYDGILLLVLDCECAYFTHKGMSDRTSAEGMFGQYVLLMVSVVGT